MNDKFKNNEERIKYLNQKHEEMAINQEDTLVLDFDEALKEESAENLKIKLLGKYYDLPKDIPFNFSTFLLRYCYKKVRGKLIMSIPDDKLYTFLELMIGKDFVKDLENSNNRNVSINFIFQKVVPKIMEEWGQNVDFNSDKVKNLQKKMSIPGS